ncbi:MAG: molybdopterin molybdotransferase MoeA [Bacteroidota bacterium]
MKPDLIPIEQATQTVLSHLIHLDNEQVPLEKALGRILREDLFADRDFPPYHRITMDGIAIRYSAFENGIRRFPIQAIQAAGAPQDTLADEKHCLEVMTGAILPNGTDTIIRYEDLNIQNGIAEITVDSIRAQQNVHHQGSDRKQGSLIVRAGQRISPAEIGVAATIGKTALTVARLPKVVIITTGDELVKVGAQPLPHQIRSSNVYKIKTALADWGIPATALHLLDDKASMQSQLSACLEQYEVLILSGGVSKGKFDFVPEVLSNLKVTKYFHRVAQRPGKPFWFGGTEKNRVFALPGNPVSSFMCLQRYFMPWIRASLGLPAMASTFAILNQDFHFKPNLTYFLQVKTNFDAHGQLLARPIEGNGSGDLANLVDADAFLELPRGQARFEKGVVYPIWFYRSIE